MALSDLQVVCFGEVLWDVLPTEAFPGGAPMNVAYHLKMMGTQPALLTKVGNDKYGSDLVQYLSGRGVDTSYIDVDQQHPTGLVYAKVSNAHEVTYDIVYPSAWDFITWKDAYASPVKAAGYFVFGSLAARSKVSRHTLYQLLQTANKKVLDINLRPPNFDKAQIQYLLQKADILKMNLLELEEVAGWFGLFKDTEARMAFLQSRFSIETLIVTMGENGAMVSEQGSLYRHTGYKVKVADTIGSGDAFLAGFLHQKINGATVENALAYAAAAGACVASKNVACPVYSVDEITALVNAATALNQS